MHSNQVPKKPHFPALNTAPVAKRRLIDDLGKRLDIYERMGLLDDERNTSMQEKNRTATRN